MTEASDLQPLFAPRSVAVVGASADPAKLGATVLNNVVASGFGGAIFPVGRSDGPIAGLRSYPSLVAVGEAIDLAFLMIPAAAVDQALEDAAAAGVKVAIVGASGFAESGEFEAQERQAEIAGRTGLRIVGPNCNGIYNAHLPLSVGFNRAHARRLRAGGVAILSHSGALFEPLVRLLTAYGAGLSCFVSAGNEVDLAVLDYAEYLIEDRDTRVIAMLVDALTDGARFARLVRRADALGKSIVMLKLGTSALGMAAAVAHSSRMTGSAAAYGAFFRSLGVPVATSIEGLMASAALLDRFGRRTGGLAAITSSGAGGSLIADLGARYDLCFADYTPPTCGQLDEWKRFSILGNPTDLGVFGDPRYWHEIFEAISRDDNVGVVMGYSHSFGGATGVALRDALANARTASDKPVILLAPGGFEPDEVFAYAERGVPVLSESDACLQAISAVLTPRADHPIYPVQASVDLPQGGEPMGEAESLALLADWGINVVPVAACRTVDEAIAAADLFGWPVAVKGAVAGLAHKSDVGLVRLDLADAEAIRRAVDDFGADVSLVVQPMIKGELEAILGVARAPGVGLVVMAGLGGIYAEAIGDICLWILDESRAAITDRLGRSALGRVLSSSRWSHPENFEALVDAITALQRFATAAGDRLGAVDINPLILGAHGVTAVDALVIPRAPAATVTSRISHE